MSTRISRSLFAMAIALGMLAAVSSPSHAALSTADRSAAPAPAQQTTIASIAAPETLAVATPTATAAAPVAKVAAPVPVTPRKTVARKAKPQGFAATSAFAAPQRFAATSRYGYPCH